MGTATVEVYPNVLGLLLDQGVTLVRGVEMGDGVLLCEIESELLPEGYNGQVDVILGGDRVRFRRNVDT